MYYPLFPDTTFFATLGYNDVIKSRLETTEDQILTRHQRKLKLKKLEDQLNEENELILDLIKLYQQVLKFISKP